MTVDTQLCVFKTEDNERLHGLMFKPADTPSRCALLFIHGVAMNFYLPPLSLFGQELAARGYHSFVINTRGHDWISRAGNLTKFGGSSYETLEECLPDLDGALQFLHEQGYRQFVLVGHSLGAIKSIIYQGTRQRDDVTAVVACSAPKQFYSERVARSPEYKISIDQAEQLLESGRGEQLLHVNVGTTPGLFSARTHVNKYGRNDGNDCRPYARKIGCPLLTLVGGAEPPFFHEYAKEIVACAEPHGTYRLIDGANHFYNRHTPQMVDAIDDWLRPRVD